MRLDRVDGLRAVAVAAPKRDERVGRGIFSLRLTFHRGVSVMAWTSCFNFRIAGATWRENDTVNIDPLTLPAGRREPRDRGGRSGLPSR